MYRVMIVDDEPLMREGLMKKIHWERLGCELAAEAMDGIAALELLETAQPHIMLTDIRMPEMDGLELVRRAKEWNNELICIIISGHSDFEYARTAMKYGIYDYLLKPVDNDELNSVLAKRIEQLTEADEHNRYRQSLLLEYEHAREEVRDLSLTRLAGQENSAGEADLQQWWPAVSGDSEISSVVLAPEPFSLPHISFRAGDEALIWYGMRNIIEECLSSDHHQGLVFRHAYRQLEMVVFLVPDARHPEPYRWVARALQEIDRCLKLRATAGVGQTVRLHEGLAHGYATASEAVRSKAVHGPGKVYHSKLVHPHLLAVKEVLPTDEAIRYLYSMLDHRRLDAVQLWIKEALSKLRAYPESGSLHLDYVSQEISSILIRYDLQREGNMDRLEQEKLLTYRYRSRFNSLDEAAEQLGHVARLIVSQEGKAEELTGEQIVGEVSRYIDRFYYQNITLSWVAETFYIHANYFSRLFKETTGQSFSDYLTVVRMTHAKAMLEDPAIPVQQIGYLVGYDNPSYFSSVFRKHCGQSPSKYREQRQG